MSFKLKDAELWKDFSSDMDSKAFKHSFVHHLKYTQAEGGDSATPHDTYMCTALAVRDRLIDRMLKTQQTYLQQDVKRAYYLSLEYLMGRYLTNNILNLRYFDTVRQALDDMGLDLEDFRRQEPDAGLGNGGLGRLAACFLDSLATLAYPAYGYGIRYEYGIFRQELVDGYQVERPDDWLRWGNPWEIPRPETVQLVEFEGRVLHETDERGHHVARWVDTKKVIAQPFDTPIVGYGTNNVNLLRLWSAVATDSFDFQIFNNGDYVAAVMDKVAGETITRVLYPNDETPQGRELRFRQQIFFVQATLKDIIRRYKKNHQDMARFADKTAVQLNDTHPALSISELMRLLVDVERLPWERAWEATTAVFGYTNHTLMPEALERWPVELVGRLVPRNLEIVYEINRRFLNQVAVRWPGDEARQGRMSIIEEGRTRQVRMAHLAVVGSHSVNGVAALHTRLLQERVLPDFAQLWPERFNNKTNGVTQRRWLLQSNPLLSAWITSHIGDGWIRDAEQLRKLLPLADDAKARRQFRDIKRQNKERLAAIIKRDCSVEVDPDSIFDVQIKRLHEYKRQHLNALHVLMLYNRLKRVPAQNIVPRTFIFGGKAAPGYAMAKRIIKLITSIGELVNNDPDVGGRIKVVFVPNYRVSLASRMFPAADVSEQISTAGHEASGTGNMKFALNGALTVGTLDGANVEILEEVGAENIFIFGLTAEEVVARKRGFDSQEYYYDNPEIREVMDQLASGVLCPGQPDLFRPIVDDLLHHGDPYMVLADLESYAAVQQRVNDAYRDQESWTRMAMNNVARCGKFSSDRTIRQYAEEIWGIEPVEVTMPPTTTTGDCAEPKSKRRKP